MGELYKSNRIIDGKPKWVIVDENGEIVNRNPAKEELKGLKTEFHKIKMPKRYVREQLLEILRKFGREKGSPPTCNDFRCNPRYPSCYTFMNEFGSWNNATELAGFIPIIGGEYQLWKQRKTKDLEERFWEKVIKKGDNECWLWTGVINSENYKCGRIKFNGKNELTHRISWILHYGNIPEEMNVLHKCDNPQCVNPNHLFLGSHEDNMNDMVNKDRCNKAYENNGNAKLTWDIVNEIRKRYDIDPEIKKYGSSRNPILSNDYEISEGQIWRILSNKSWIPRTIVKVHNIKNLETKDHQD